MNKYLIGGGLSVLLFLLVVVLGDKKAVDDGNGTGTPVTSFSHAHGLALDLVTPGKLYIATHEGLYLFEDDTELSRVGKSTDDLMGFTAHPTQKGVFFSSGHPSRGGNSGFRKSVDGGVTWEMISPGVDGPVDFHSMTVSMANSEVLYGLYAGRLQKTSDGGVTWTYLAEVLTTPRALSTHPTDENTVYAATQNGVEVSRDGGVTWASLSSALTGGAVSVFTVNPHNAQNALVFSERLGGLGKSEDGGVTWESGSETFEGEAVLYLGFSVPQQGLAYALTAQQSVYKSVDGGDSWTKVR